MLSESVTEKYLSLQFSQFGPVSHVAIDRTRGHGLVFYDQVSFICNILSIYWFLFNINLHNQLSI